MAGPRKYGVRFMPIVDIDLDALAYPEGVEICWAGSGFGAVWDYDVDDLLDPDDVRRAEMNEAGSEVMDRLLPDLCTAIAKVCEAHGLVYRDDQRPPEPEPT